ncbi:ANTAR domain-containing response regulator [Amphiplicatus metriothermophilus]|uniref:Response regulator receiver and ANTAR domain protein n=1 Tax=Amphiplicatus metriothermophilus TaxID=1519374 RepID=A0A239PQ26_9PROT|nr:ANTAR domain-containing protein [Amphiplicatus metriothermophilus]MBB5518690.1 response regulator NasT [Amphiplicatus metriothermophilus]SNT72153.1 response regulator receiver and ANTAR domain protein [Amphiplicatus metriothermophilus]
MERQTETPLIVLLIDSKPERAKIVEDGLRGAAVVRQAPALHGAELLAVVERLQPDAIIIDCDSPDRDTIENLQLVARKNPKPIVMFVENGDGALAREAVRAGVSAYIVDGLSERRVLPVLEIAIERFRMFDALWKDLERSKRDLEARKVIERAKGLLMQKRGLSENDAYAAMRTMAMNQGKTIKDVADNILAVASLFDD